MSRTKTPRIVVALAALCAALLTAPVVRAEPPSKASVPVAASTALAVYALVGGVPVNVSATASYGEGQVYLSGTWFGSLLPNGDIVNGGTVVGFVLSSDL